MPKSAANLTLLCTELPLLDRFESNQIADALGAAGLTLVLHNLPAGDWDGGERGIACDPARAGEFAQGVDQAIDTAQSHGCPRLNCLAGIPPAGQDAALLGRTLIDNLRFTAKAVGEAGIALVLEPVNTRDVPGFFVSRTAPAPSIPAAVGSEHLRLQHDIDHARMMEGDLARSIGTRHGPIGHIRAADDPGRPEPGTGETDFPRLFERIGAFGYDGPRMVRPRKEDAGMSRLGFIAFGIMGQPMASHLTAGGLAYGTARASPRLAATETARRPRSPARSSWRSASRPAPTRRASGGR